MCASLATETYPSSPDRRRALRALAAGLASWLALALPAAAQVTTDGSVGRGGAKPVASGIDDRGDPATYLIRDKLGEQRGGNLYHSFGEFSIQTGETATFTSRDPPSVLRILSRVTGGLPSNIHGTLRSTVPGAALYLMNPAGVMFGEGSSLDIPGSLHITTADYLRHTDGTQFPATATAPTTLGIAPIDAFGFWDSEVGKIALHDTRLELPAGETLSLIGGDIEVLGFPEGAEPDFGNLHSAILVPSGRVNLAAVASPGEVEFDDSRAAPRLDVDSFDALGNIRFAEQASLTVNGDPGGTVAIRAHDLEVSDEGPELVPFPGFPAGVAASRIKISSVTQGEVDHPGIGLDVDLRGDLTLENASFLSRTLGSGRGGDVRVRADGVSVTGPAFPFSTDIGINTWTFSAGDAGNLELDADHIDLFGLLNVGSIALGSSGNAGDISMIARTLTMDGGLREPGRAFATNLLSATLFGSGRAGNLSIHADEIQIIDGAQLLTGSLFGATGDAGSIAIDTRQFELRKAEVSAPGPALESGGSIDITASQIDIGNFGGVHEGPSGGTGGTITITADRLTIRDAGFVHPGTGGSVTITADEIALLDGGRIYGDSAAPTDAGEIIIRAGSLLVSGVYEDPFQVPFFTLAPSQIASVTTGAGRGGDITIVADQVQVLDSGRISSQTAGEGRAGDLTIIANDVVVSGVNAEWESFLHEGFPHLPELVIRGAPSAITAASSLVPGFFTATGDAGNVHLSGGAGSELRLEDRGKVSSDTLTTGAGGDVFVDFDRVRLAGGGTISVESLLDDPGAGNAGNITIHAGDFRAEGGVVTARSVATDAGDIELVVQQGVELFGSSITSAVGGGAGTTGGNIAIDPVWVILENGSRIIADAVGGAGGNIDITTQGLFVSSDSVIDASSQVGVSGTVQVNAPDTNLSGNLTPLSDRYLAAAELRRNRCAVAGTEAAGSFVLGVGAGLPDLPDAPLPSFSPGSLQEGSGP